MKSWFRDLALLAIGFTGAEKGGLVKELNPVLDERGNIQTVNYMTSQEGVCDAGDIGREQSLVVWLFLKGERRTMPQISGSQEDRGCP